MSVLLMNAIAISLTWLVVFKWNLGFEYNPDSLWQLATYGPIGTLVVTQLTLMGVFLFVKTGLGRIAKSKFQRSIKIEKITNQFEMQERFLRISVQYRRITNAVLLTIVSIVALDLLNDLSQVLPLFLHAL